MNDDNPVPVFDVDCLESAFDWFQNKGKSAFGTFAGFQWFCRTHQNELLKSGLYFPGKGSAPTRVSSNFGELVIKIKQREAAEMAAS